MKKLLISLFIFLNLYLTANADVMPYYVNSIRRAGIGYTKVSSPLVMRREAKIDGEILETLNFNYKEEITTCLINKERCQIDEVFIAYSKSKKLAFMTTLDSIDNWNLVCFNQIDRPVCGWIEEDKIQKTNKFYTLGEFFEEFGRKYGVYLFKDLQKPDKILYGAPVSHTNSIGSIDMPKLITPWLIRGNWILVKVIDFNNQMKTGWINFRGNDGKLKMFVKF